MTKSISCKKEQYSHFTAGIICSKSAIETPEQCVKSVQSSQ